MATPILDNKIDLVRGDTFKSSLFINEGIKTKPSRYELQPEDEVLFSVYQPGEDFESGFIKKKFTLRDCINTSTIIAPKNHGGYFDLETGEEIPSNYDDNGQYKGKGYYENGELVIPELYTIQAETAYSPKNENVRIILTPAETRCLLNLRYYYMVKLIRENGEVHTIVKETQLNIKE